MGGRQGQKKAQNGKGVFQEGEPVYKRLLFLQKKDQGRRRGPLLCLCNLLLLLHLNSNTRTIWVRFKLINLKQIEPQHKFNFGAWWLYNFFNQVSGHHWTANSPHHLRGSFCWGEGKRKAKGRPLKGRRKSAILSPECERKVDLERSFQWDTF